MTLRCGFWAIKMALILIEFPSTSAFTLAMMKPAQGAELWNNSDLIAERSTTSLPVTGQPESRMVKRLTTTRTEVAARVRSGGVPLNENTNFVISTPDRTQSVGAGQPVHKAAEQGDAHVKNQQAFAVGEAVLPPLCGPSGFSTAEIKKLVVEAAQDHEIDETFALAVAFVESGFDRWRNSPKGARGVMQLMPSTALRFDVVDVCDPRANIAGGAKYLRVLKDEFRNPLLVAAAYNAGEARIHEYGGIPPFKETVNYVAKVVNYQLGLSLPPAHKTVGSLREELRRADQKGPQAGIVPVVKDRTFTGGVMHF